jgi:Domain of unknown function (DUF4177)
VVQWEYRAIELTGSHSGVDDIAVLNEAGRDGWELVRITANNIAYLKRPIERSDETNSSSGGNPH